MIALFFLLLIAGAAVAHTDRPYKGVDPNSLSCDPLGEVFLLLPHHTDCQLYYQCVHGKEVLMPGCPASLIFDFEAQTCNWPWATQCILRGTNNDESDSGSGDFDETQEGSGDFDETQEGSGDFDKTQDAFKWLHIEEVNDAIETTHKRVARDVSEKVSDKMADEVIETFAPRILDCSEPNSAARHVAYKGDCQRFWRCVAGVPQTFFCNDGLFFNEATQTCDFEANVRCAENAEEELGQEFIVY